MHIIIYIIIPRPSSGIQILVSKINDYDMLNNDRIAEFSPNYQKEVEWCCPAISKYLEIMFFSYTPCMFSSSWTSFSRALSCK